MRNTKKSINLELRGPEDVVLFVKTGLAFLQLSTCDIILQPCLSVKIIYLRQICHSTLIPQR